MILLITVGQRVMRSSWKFAFSKPQNPLKSYSLVKGAPSLPFVNFVQAKGVYWQ